MLDIWIGDINLTLSAATLALLVVLPVQLLLCFRCRSLAIRLGPVLLSILSILLCLLLFSVSKGLEGVVWLILGIYAAFFLLVCAVGWGIWAAAAYFVKKRF